MIATLTIGKRRAFSPSESGSTARFCTSADADALATWTRRRWLELARHRRRCHGAAVDSPRTARQRRSRRAERRMPDGRLDHSGLAAIRVVTAAACGVAMAIVSLLDGASWSVATLAGWSTAALGFLVWVWW